MWATMELISDIAKDPGKKKYNYFIILPKSKWKGVWDMINLTLILTVCVLAPLKIAFSDEED